MRYVLGLTLGALVVFSMFAAPDASARRKRDRNVRVIQLRDDAAGAAKQAVAQEVKQAVAQQDVKQAVVQQHVVQQDVKQAVVQQDVKQAVVQHAIQQADVKQVIQQDVKQVAPAIKQQ